jgi:hypothetical protein
VLRYLNSVRQSSFFLRIFKYYYDVILLCISFIDSGLPSGIFASFQRSTLAGKRQKAAKINCVNSILAVLASQPVCTIIDAGMQYLSSMLNNIGLVIDSGALSDRLPMNAFAFIPNEMDHRYVTFRAYTTNRWRFSNES